MSDRNKEKLHAFFALYKHGKNKATIGLIDQSYSEWCNIELVMHTFFECCLCLGKEKHITKTRLKLQAQLYITVDIYLPIR